MEDTPDFDLYLDAALTLLGIPVEAEWRKLIRFQLGVSLAHARRVQAFALPDEAEPAPVFRA